ncbi:MAG: S26 family signal peptidase, partial [Methanobacteriota archaeon]
RKRPSPMVLFLRDAGIALVFVVSILLAMYAYTGLWPPLVVVESESMMHSEDNTSYIGVIDTGDMVLVKDVDRAEEVVTYVEGFGTGHRTYGDYGDVIIYNKMGNTADTPIIHRAVLYLEVNPDGESYSCEALRDLPSDKWALSDQMDSWDHLTRAIYIYDYGYRDATVVIDVGDILDAFRTRAPSSGFITRGDHNTWIDQRYHDAYSPVDESWIVGKARGEIPWFGLLKLWFSDTLRSPAPDNSVRNLWISIILIVVTPIILDVILTYRVRKRISRKREAAVRDHDRERREEAAAPSSEEVEEGEPPAPPSDGGSEESSDQPEEIT